MPLSVVRMTPRGKVVSRDSSSVSRTRTMTAPIVLRLPDEPVAIGDTWDEPFDVRSTSKTAAPRSIQTRRHHKLADRRERHRHDRSHLPGALADRRPIESQLVQRLMSGEVRFDIDAGRVVSQQMDVDKRDPRLRRPHQQHAIRDADGREAADKPPKVAAKPAKLRTLTLCQTNASDPSATSSRCHESQRNRRRPPATRAGLPQSDHNAASRAPLTQPRAAVAHPPGRATSATAGRYRAHDA